MMPSTFILRRSFNRPTAVVLLVVSAFAVGCDDLQGGAGAPVEERPNVLFITIDGSAPAFGCYGDEAAHTPHIDAITAEGMGNAGRGLLSARHLIASTPPPVK